MQKGLTLIWIAIGILLLILGYFGWRYYQLSLIADDYWDLSKACQTDAMICPDGTSVGRTGPNCEFVACPNQATDSAETAYWKTYNNSKLGISFSHPQVWVVKGENIIDVVPGSELDSSSNGPIQLDYANNPKELSLKEFEEANINEFSGMGPGFHDPQAVEKMISGITAYYSQNAVCEPVYCDKYVILYKGKIWRFILFEPNSEKRKIFDQLVSTLKFN